MLEALRGVGGDAIKEDGTIAAAFEVRRTGSNATDLVVNIAGIAGSGLATPGADYYALPTTVTIPAGQDAVRLQAYPIVDTAAEATEAVRAAVQAGAGYSIGTASVADVAIRDASSPSVVRVTSARYDADNFPPALRVAFSDNVSLSLSLSDVTLFNRSTNQVVPSNQFGLAYEPSTGIARVYAVGGSHVFADGNYRLTIAASGISGPMGQPLDGNNDGVAGDNLVVDFFVLTGDANHDGQVNFADLVILAQNYNQTGKVFSQRNFNYSVDGRVDFQDLVTFARHYNAMAASSFVALLPLEARMIRERSIDSVLSLEPEPVARKSSGPDRPLT